MFRLRPVHRFAKLSIEVSLSDEGESEVEKGVERKTEEERGRKVLKRQEIKEKTLRKQLNVPKRASV